LQMNGLTVVYSYLLPLASLTDHLEFGFGGIAGAEVETVECATHVADPEFDWTDFVRFAVDFVELGPTVVDLVAFGLDAVGVEEDWTADPDALDLSVVVFGAEREKVIDYKMLHYYFFPTFHFLLAESDRLGFVASDFGHAALDVAAVGQTHLPEHRSVSQPVALSHPAVAKAQQVGCLDLPLLLLLDLGLAFDLVA